MDAPTNLLIEALNERIDQLELRIAVLEAKQASQPAPATQPFAWPVVPCHPISWPTYPPYPQPTPIWCGTPPPSITCASNTKTQ